jgi:hypothetical protein
MVEDVLDSEATLPYFSSVIWDAIAGVCFTPSIKRSYGTAEFVFYGLEQPSGIGR